MANSIKPSLILIAIIEYKRFVVALPRPFIMLDSEDEVYIKGHKNAIYSNIVPDSILLNIISPSSLPKVKNKPELSNPINIQKVMLLLVILDIEDWSVTAFAADIVGNNIVDRAPVRVLGNIIKGNTIPVKVPNIDKLVSELL